ncbi:MAG: hypothetical protein AAGU75_13990, partial [Bacillota bacterium]
MRKLSQRQRKWLASHSNKAIKRLSKGKAARRRRTLPRGKNWRHDTNKSKRKHILLAPTSLSLVQNRGETLVFFSKVLHTIKKCTVRDTIYFDLSKIEYISTDAIMYIIALIRNVPRLSALRVDRVGNLPRNQEARALIEKSGFYKFVSVSK